MAEIALTIQDAVKTSGLARSRIYMLLAEGTIDARKAGKRTLVMGESLRRYIESLPPAQFRAPAKVA